MNIKPRLDTNIPKGYAYIQVTKPEYYQDSVERYKLDLKTKKLSKQEKSDLKENIDKYTGYMDNAKETMNLLDSHSVINLYFNKEIIHDISRDDYSNFDFMNKVFYKIKPIAMTKTWQTNNKYGTYDLNSFIAIDRFDSIEELTKSLYDDGILKDFVLTYFLKHAYNNEGYDVIRHSYLKYIKDNYSDYMFSLYDVYDRFSNYNGEYSGNNHRTELVKQAYNLGLVNLYDRYRYTDNVIRMLLIEREFDLLKDFLDGLDNNELKFLAVIIENYSNQESTKLTIKLALENSSNETVKKLIKIMNIKSSGIILKVMSYDEWEREYFECTEDRKTFDDIDELKRHIITEYKEISLDKVMNNKFDELYLDENNTKLVIEIIE